MLQMPNGLFRRDEKSAPSNAVDVGIDAGYSKLRCDRNVACRDTSRFRDLRAQRLIAVAARSVQLKQDRRSGGDAAHYIPFTTNVTYATAVAYLEAGIMFRRMTTIIVIAATLAGGLTATAQARGGGGAHGGGFGGAHMGGFGGAHMGGFGGAHIGGFGGAHLGGSFGGHHLGGFNGSHLGQLGRGGLGTIGHGGLRHDHFGRHLARHRGGFFPGYFGDYGLYDDGLFDYDGYDDGNYGCAAVLRHVHTRHGWRWVRHRTC
jgi:hypothetical protein